MVEKEIKENYAANLTLKGLSENTMSTVPISGSCFGKIWSFLQGLSEQFPDGAGRRPSDPHG